MPKRIIFSLMTIFIVLTSAGCGASDQSAETWTIVTDIAANAQNDANLQKSFTPLDRQRIDATNLLMSSSREVKGSFTHYTLTAEGQNYEDLAKYISIDKNNTITRIADKQAVVSMHVPNTLSDIVTVTIHVKKIIRNNANSATDNTAVWDSTKGASEINATLELPN